MLEEPVNTAEHAGHHHDHDHGHQHHDPSGVAGFLKSIFRPHSHSASDSIDDPVAASSQGIRAVQLSLAGLGVTALLQLFIVAASGSVALLADTIHNFGDALTAIPLWLAFHYTRRAPTRRYTYGYGRAEDLAGVFIVLMMAASTAFAGYESVRRLISPEPIDHLLWVAAAGVIGFVGNEAVAEYRIRVGNRIGSAALVADGYHARTDGLTSLAVLLGAGGVWLGWDYADPIVGLVITLAIVFVLKGAVVDIWRRLMDAIEPEVLDAATAAAESVDGVVEVTSIRPRWVGHVIHAEAYITVDREMTVADGHLIAEDVSRRMTKAVPKLASAIVHVDPCDHEPSPTRSSIATTENGHARAGR